MPTKSTFSPGATTSRMPRPAAARSSALLGGGADEVAAGFLVGLKRDELLALGFLEQVGKGAEAVVGLVEPGLAALERLLDHRAPDLLALAALGDERVKRLDHQVEGLLLLVALFAAGGRGLAPLLRRAPLLLVLAHQIVVVDELVAIGDQQVGAGVLHPYADHRLRVLTQLRHQRREIRVAADDDEGVDVLLGVAKVERVYDH